MHQAHLQTQTIKPNEYMVELQESFSFLAQAERMPQDLKIVSKTNKIFHKLAWNTQIDYPLCAKEKEK